MISLSDFFTVPPVRLVSCVVRDLETSPGGTRHCGPTRPAHNTCGKGRSAVRRKGNDVSTYRDVGLSALTAFVLTSAAGVPSERWCVRPRGGLGAARCGASP